MSFTPGPWAVVGPLFEIHTAGDPYGHGTMLVADVRGWGHLTGRGGGCAFGEAKAIAIQAANARLIAAAPELLNALRDASKTITALLGNGAAKDQWWATMPTAQRIKAAIVKAEARADD